MKPNSMRALLFTASTLALCVSASSAWAQAAPPAAPAAAGDAATNVDQVVVTGALRTERLQEVPLAVTSVSQAEFLNSGFKEPRELQFLSPSIQVSIQGGNSIFIRGSGTASQNSGTEQSVGLVLDGVVQGFVDDIGGDISDLDHIEVYRGPQGTQFAKNASSGIVSITTKLPEIAVLSAAGHFAYGEHNDINDWIHFNAPISDTMAARFDISYQNRDGVFPNVVRHEFEGARQQIGYQAKLIWKPRERTSVLLAFDFRRESESPNFPQAWLYCGPPGPTTAYVNVYGTHNLPPCNGALLAGITPSPTNDKIVEADDAWRHTDTGGAAMTIQYPLGEFELTSISAFRFMSRHLHGPSGSGIQTNSFLNTYYGGPQLSQELRLASPPSEKLEYTLGMFLYRRSTLTKSWGIGPQYGLAYFEYPNTPYGSSVAISSAGGGTYANNTTKSIAGFADGTYHFTSQLQMVAGVRLTYDDASASILTKPLVGVYPSTVGAALKPPGSDDITATGFTYRVGPQFFFTPDVQLYATASHGYKGPLVDTSVTPILGRIVPETNNAYEVGLKSAWFDHKLVIDINAFYEKFRNYQTTTLNTSVVPNVFQLGNAGGMRSQGVELETTAKPTHDLTLTFGMTYLDAIFTDFKLACYNAAEPIKQATTTDPNGVGGCYTPPTGTKFANAAGDPLTNSSKWTFRLGLTYIHDIKDGWTFDSSANYLHRSTWWAAPTDPNLINPGYGILNLAAGISPPNGNWRFGLFVRNAFNKFFFAGEQANNGGATLVLNTEAVRTIGGSVDLKFQ